MVQGEEEQSRKTNETSHQIEFQPVKKPVREVMLVMMLLQLTINLMYWKRQREIMGEILKIQEGITSQLLVML